MAEVQTSTQTGEMTQRFIEFVMMQAQNAALFLGQIPNPQTGQGEVNLEVARMFIDQLAMIQEKTRGNLSSEEAGGAAQHAFEFADGFRGGFAVWRRRGRSAVPPQPADAEAEPQASAPVASEAPAPEPPSAGDRSRVAQEIHEELRRVAVAASLWDAWARSITGRAGGASHSEAATDAKRLQDGMQPACSTARIEVRGGVCS